MTEQEWLCCDDPDALLSHLDSQHAIGGRKLTLFAAACCRNVWKLLGNEFSEKAVELTERWADGKAGTNEVIEAHERARLVSGTPARTAVEEACVVALKIGGARRVAHVAAWAHLGRTRAEERQHQSNLIRCIFGYRATPMTIDNELERWNSRTIRAIAEGIYDDRAFDRIPILADALEDAGCDNIDILKHCRGGGPHVRGCWVVDLVLGKT